MSECFERNPFGGFAAVAVCLRRGAEAGNGYARWIVPQKWCVSSYCPISILVATQSHASPHHSKHRVTWKLVVPCFACIHHLWHDARGAPLADCAIDDVDGLEPLWEEAK